MEIYLSNKRIEKLVLLVKQENKYHTRNILEFINFHSIKKKKKNGACVFWAPVFFLSFLAGK